MDAGRPAKRQRLQSPPRQRNMKAPEKPSLFLRIPLELRLQIYNYALDDVTITVAEKERILSDTTLLAKSRIQGVPAEWVPLVKNEYDAEMMQIRKLAVIPYTGPAMEQAVIEQPSRKDSLALSVTSSLDSGYASAGSSMYSNVSFASSTTSFDSCSADEVPTPPEPVTLSSLLKVSKQIREELMLHLKHPQSRETTLYVTYPYGLCVLQDHYPELIHHARHVVITGEYDPVEGSPDAVTPRLRSLAYTLYKNYNIGSPTDFFNRMTTLQMRIFYPMEDTKRRLWRDDASPVTLVMRYIPCGDIGTKIWRGGQGTGAVLTANPIPQAKLKDIEATALDRKRGEPRIVLSEEEAAKAKNAVPEKPTYKWPRYITSSWRKNKSPYTSTREGLTRHQAMMEARREEFWETSFHDAGLFEAERPEGSCWLW